LSLVHFGKCRVGCICFSETFCFNVVYLGSCNRYVYEILVYKIGKILSLYCTSFDSLSRLLDVNSFSKRNVLYSEVWFYLYLHFKRGQYSLCLIITNCYLNVHLEWCDKYTLILFGQASNTFILIHIATLGIYGNWRFIIK